MPRRARASRSSISIWALTLRRSAAAHRLTASRIAFSSRSGKATRSGAAQYDRIRRNNEFNLLNANLMVSRLLIYFSAVKKRLRPQTFVIPRNQAERRWATLRHERGYEHEEIITYGNSSLRCGTGVR